MLVVGLVLLVAGGRAAVEGASRLARSMGISELTVGLTVVAFGTSAPELSVNVVAAIRGDGAIAFGNVVGSNMANLALVIGVAALARPLVIGRGLVYREVPMMLLATAAALVLGLDRLRTEPEVYDRSDGIALLLFFLVFLYYTVAEVVVRRRALERGLEAPGWMHGAGREAAWMALVLTVAGFFALVAGGRLTVSGALEIADGVGAPEELIGLTIVAIGTSLPELVTSLVAALRGQADLAVGNVVGSNIFNLLFILSTAAVIADIPVPAGGVDLLALVGFSVVLLPLALRDGARIARWHGALLLVVYAGYMAWRAVG
jgi:cation:H+ antiporter